MQFTFFINSSLLLTLRYWGNMSGLGHSEGAAGFAGVVRLLAGRLGDCIQGIARILHRDVGVYRALMEKHMIWER